MTAQGRGPWIDIALTVLVTVLLGSLVAACAALASDRFLSRTVSGVIGDYGEYDLIVHVRQDLAQAAERQISDVLTRRFPGSTFKKGITLAGRANFLVSVGPRWRNRQGFESVLRALGDLPGGAGRTTMVEPRVTLSEVNPGVRSELMARIERLPEVAFAFRDGSGISAVLRSESTIEQARAKIRALSSEYQVIEARFPIGLDAGDEVALGRRVAAAINERFGPGSARDVTAAAVRGDTSDLADTLAEMRSFLEHYSASARISLAADASLAAGQTVRLRHGSCLLSARVEEAGGPGTGEAKAMVTRGSLPAGSSSWVWEVEVTRAAGPVRVGTAVVSSEKNYLASTIQESIKLLESLDALSRSGLEVSNRLLEALDSRDEMLVRLVSARRLLERVDSMIAGAADGASGVAAGVGAADIQAALKALDGAVKALDSVDSALGGLSSVASQTAQVDELARQVDRLLGTASSSVPSSSVPSSSVASSSVGDLGATAAGVRALVRSVSERAVGGTHRLDSLVPSLAADLHKLDEWRATVGSLASGLRTVASAVADPAGTRANIGRLLQATDSAIDVLRSADTYALRETLANASEDLSAVQSTDLQAIAQQLNYVRDSLPDLDDGKVGRTIALVDRYLGGEVIPGDRVQTVVKRSLPTATLTRLVRAELGPSHVAVFATPVATLDPGVRGELFRILREARATVGFLVCAVIVLLSLVLDHATVGSYIAWVRRQATATGRGRARLYAAGYGSFVGSLTLSGLLLVSGTRPPFGGAWLGPCVGAGLGIAVGLLCERISPIDAEEALAGRAMGLSLGQILREVVLPSGRPGVALLLSPRLRRFKGGAGANAFRPAGAAAQAEGGLSAR